VIDTSVFLSDQCKYADDVPVIGRAQVEAVSQEILSAYMPQALSRQAPVDVEYLMEHIFGLRLELQTLQPDSSILGETVFSDGYRAVYDLNNRKTYIAVTPGTVLLDASMCEKMETRTAFTEAHELGHWVLHKRFYGATDSRACRSRRGQQMYFPHYQAKTPIDWTEWQANALLRPFCFRGRRCGFPCGNFCGKMPLPGTTSNSMPGMKTGSNTLLFWIRCPKPSAFPERLLGCG
jgi:hypothetical protein